MEKKKENNISLGNLYDMNKQAILKQPPLGRLAIDNAKLDLEQWFNWQLDGYAMLLCRERYDFTVFHLYELQNPNPPRVAANELIDVLKNRGKILAIDKDTTNDKVWEIWLKIDGEAFAYYLFNCDNFVIQC